MRNLLLLAALLASASSAATAQQTGATHPAAKAIVVMPDSAKWGPPPPVLPPGAQLAVLEGDPMKPGAYTMRLSMPDGYQIPPHYHAANEHVTVIKGEFQVGMGTKFDESKLMTLPAGTFGMLPAGMRHFARARGEAVIQLHGIGPWGLTYVNAQDDPRKHKAD
jgi:quercetin dioxygenase-like cupin family protein